MPLLYHAGALGDFLLSLPFLRSARAALPHARWTLACPEEHAALAARILPHVRRMTAGALELAPLTARMLEPAAMAALCERHGGLFGAVPRPAAVAAAAKAGGSSAPVVLVEPLSLAVAGGAAIEPLLEDGLVRLGAARRPLGPEDFALRADELPALAAGVDPLRLLPAPPPRQVALLHPGAGDRVKAAPLAVFLEAAAALDCRSFACVWVRGPVEHERGDPVPPGPLLDRPDLVRLAHAIARADFFVGNDSGPTHLASALGAPVLAVHAVENPAWRPRGSRSRVAKPLEVIRVLAELLG